jgi:hypothetical protein
VLHSLVRRPLFSAAATLAVLGATGAALLVTPQTSAAPDAAQAAWSHPTPLPDDVLASASAQASADAGDAVAQEAMEERAALVAEQQAQAAAAAAQAAAAQAAAEAAEAARAAAAEQASRDAQRDPRGLARTLVADRGWSSEQFDCLDSLWTKESDWRWDADNPTSSAYGIPQALPGSKMSTAGSDWETNPATQIRWGLGYIDDVYGTPCSAWSHSQSNNWY